MNGGPKKIGKKQSESSVSIWPKATDPRPPALRWVGIWQRVRSVVGFVQLHAQPLCQGRWRPVPALPTPCSDRCSRGCQGTPAERGRSCETTVVCVCCGANESAEHTCAPSSALPVPAAITRGNSTTWDLVGDFMTDGGEAAYNFWEVWVDDKPRN